MMSRSTALLIVAAALLDVSSSFVVTGPSKILSTTELLLRSSVPVDSASKWKYSQSCTFLKLADEKGSDEGEQQQQEEEEEVEPGKMRVSEIKAELDLRSVSYDDCFDKDSLQQRLVDARKSGKADPELLEKFNKQRLEDTFEGRKPVDETMSDDEILNQAVGNDGNLPGGLSPDQFKELVENPEIISLLQSTKMQEAMKMMMTGGQEELEAAMRSDPELREIVQKLNEALGGKLG